MLIIFKIVLLTSRKSIKINKIYHGCNVITMAQKL